MKTCPKCGETKPLSEFFRDATKSDMLSANCKKCKTLARDNWRKNHPEEARQHWLKQSALIKEAKRPERERKQLERASRIGEPKLCPQCGVIKAPSDFYAYPRSPDKLSWMCRACTKQRTKAWHQSNPERVSARHTRDLFASRGLAMSASLAVPAVPDGMKYCVKCLETKPVEAFNRHAKSKDGRQAWCRECFAAHRRLEKMRDTDKYRAIHLLSNFGITPDEYNAMYQAQDGVCAICQQPETTAGKTFLAVDHDHKTGVIRGLLCGNCNKGLGYLRDDSALLARAINYLDRPRSAALVVRQY